MSDADADRQRIPLFQWLGLLAILAFAAFVRVRLLGVPLERDEGEYAYAAQLLLSGSPPYQQFYSMKFPGIYAAYATILAAFGQTREAIHFGLLIVNAATIAAMFFLGRRLAGGVVGLLAAACFALLSLSPATQGIFANAEHFVLLPAIVGVERLLCGIDRQRRSAIAAAGLLLGAALVTKQHAAAFLAFAALYIGLEWWRSNHRHRSTLTRDLLALAAGPALIAAATLASIVASGVFDAFRFWTFEYPMQYVSQVPLASGLAVLKLRVGQLLTQQPLLYTLAGVGLAAVWCPGASRRVRTFASLFAAFGFLAVTPGLHFRPHYFQLLQPAIALLAGLGGSFLLGKKRVLGIAVIAICLAGSVIQMRAFLFTASPDVIAREIFRGQPFEASERIAGYIEERTTPEDRIAVLGSEPQIFFYSKRRSATPFIYTYPLMEVQPQARAMQEQMIREIEAADPPFIVLVWHPDSWGPQPSSDQRILQWFAKFKTSHRAVGLIEIEPGGATRDTWGPLANRKPRTRAWLLLLQRDRPRAGL